MEDRRITFCGSQGRIVRVMEIQPFERTVVIDDLESFVVRRLHQPLPWRANQGAALVSYMLEPNDAPARALREATLGLWCTHNVTPPTRLPRVQLEWLLVADVFNLHVDLTAGEHQERRGGPSVGKAVHVANALIERRGASAANLWRAWGMYKDVAHVVTAAAMVTALAQDLAKNEKIDCQKFPEHQIQPFQMTMYIPDLVLGLALTLESYGLTQIPVSREHPMLDPETLWRIPKHINAEPVAPWVREVTGTAIAALNERRAGNRGK